MISVIVTLSVQCFYSEVSSQIAQFWTLQKLIPRNIRGKNIQISTRASWNRPFSNLIALLTKNSDHDERSVYRVAGRRFVYMSTGVYDRSR